MRDAKKHPCHCLHYLQMLTEKLGKAYFYGKVTPPAKAHTGFRKLVRNLSTNPKV